MRFSQKISIGALQIGGGERIAIQTMTNTPTLDSEKTIEQLCAVEAAGCDIARLAFSSQEELALIPTYRAATHMPLVADIQFDYRLAIKAMEYGIDKVRFNPGNIGDNSHVRAVLECAKSNHVPLRIGVNSGSIPKDLLSNDMTQDERLVEAAMRNVRLCEEYDFRNLVLSVKSSSVETTVKAYRSLASMTDYPLHLGVTEAGSYQTAVVKSAVALGSLLLDGIGDTIRISVTGDVLQEITAAHEILRAAGRETNYCEIVSCPTCSRTHIDLISLEKRVRERYGDLKRTLKLAVMGCVVNGPGEANDADFGIAGGEEKGVIFVKGKVVATVAESALFSEFCKIVDGYLGQ